MKERYNKRVLKEIDTIKEYQSKNKKFIERLENEPSLLTTVTPDANLESLLD